MVALCTLSALPRQRNDKIGPDLRANSEVQLSVHVTIMGSQKQPTYEEKRVSLRNRLGLRLKRQRALLGKHRKGTLPLKEEIWSWDPVLYWVCQSL